MFKNLTKGLFLWLVAGFLIVCLVPRDGFGQAVSGTILGEVKDQSGAVVAGARVTVTNTEKGLTRTVSSDSTGEYVAPSLPPGVYTVSAEMAGFKKLTLSNFMVGVDQKVRVDLTLQVGEVTESVEVEGTAPLIQSASSELGTTVIEDQIKTLPLNGRNFVSLTRMVPGVLRGVPGSNIDGAGSLAWRASASFSANGQRTRDNNYMLDGVDNNETWLQTVVIFPNVDALDEFKLQTSTYSAEFGRSLGGVVNLQTKSGTNNLHGSAYEYFRDDHLDANNFFNNRGGRPKPSFRQNQFGGTVGGPIIKNKTFFFGDYQGFRTSQGQTYLSTVPSLKMRQGDFSEISRVIYDPTTGQPFPNKVIPQNRWDPAARNILEQLYPEPNTTGRVGSNGQPIENYLINPTLQRQDNQFDVKADHNLNEKNRFFTRYSFQKTHRLLPATLPHGDAGATFGAGDGNIKGQGIAFNDTHTFSERWLNEFRFGWTQIKFFMTSIDYGLNLAEKVGIPGVNLNEVTSAMSQIVFQNGGARNLGANGNQPLITNQNDFQFFDNLTWVKGRHTVKTGGSVTLRSREILNADLIVGQFGFHQQQTSNCANQPSPCTLIANTGFDVASFLLGYARVLDRRLFDSKTYTEKRPEYALYLQDDIRATSRLTLNLGLRWDVFVPWIEVDDRQSNFDESTGRFVVASPDAVIAGVKVGRYLQTYSKRDFGPRFGFAYDLDGKGRTILRGGWGMFWNFTPGGTSSSKAQNQPFNQITTLTSEFGIGQRLSSGLPPPPGVDPNRPAAGATRSIFDINFRDGYAQNFNVNLQRQFGTNYVLEVTYAGSRARQLMMKGNPNQARPVAGVRDSNVNRPYAQVSPALRDIGQAQSRGTLDYHGLLVKFQRRFSDNISVLNSYTYGKSIDLNSDNDGNVSFLNVYDIERYHRAPSDYQVTHTFSSSWLYELPWTKNRWYGGWQLNGILYLRSGLPFNVTQTQGVVSTGQGNRPNRICDGRLGSPTIDRWFDTSCFVPPADTTGTYGNSGRNILRGPGQFNIDLSLLKRTRFLERFDTEFRLETFNTLNHPQFAQPNGQIGNASVGRITSMLSNPSCSLCGTTERQIQLVMRFMF